jgi:hypothetical protein
MTKDKALWLVGNITLGFIKGGEFLGKLSYYQFLKNVLILQVSFLFEVCWIIF